MPANVTSDRTVASPLVLSRAVRIAFLNTASDHCIRCASIHRRFDLQLSTRSVGELEFGVAHRFGNSAYNGTLEFGETRAFKLRAVSRCTPTFTCHPLLMAASPNFKDCAASDGYIGTPVRARAHR